MPPYSPLPGFLAPSLHRPCRHFPSTSYRSSSSSIRHYAQVQTAHQDYPPSSSDPAEPEAGPSSRAFTPNPRQRRSSSVAGGMTQEEKAKWRFVKKENPTPYEVLHLPRTAQSREIKSRYYQLAKLYHPDATHPDSSSENFNLLSKAYTLLGSDHTRLSYNRTGIGWNPTSNALRPNSSFGRGGFGRPGDDDLLRQARQRHAGFGGSGGGGGYRNQYGGYAHGYGYASSGGGDAYGRAKWDGFHDHEGPKAEKGGNYMSNERFLGALGVLGIAFACMQFSRAYSYTDSHRELLEARSISAAKALQEARTDAQLYGRERREAIRRYVRSMEVEREYERMSEQGGGVAVAAAGGEIGSGRDRGEVNLDQ